MSGGQGADEPVSEAYAMRKYLLSQHIPENMIILEDQSTTTYENMLFQNSLLKKIGSQDLRVATQRQVLSFQPIIIMYSVHVYMPVECILRLKGLVHQQHFISYPQPSYVNTWPSYHTIKYGL